MKKITLKIDFDLDDDCKFIAQDKDGGLYAFYKMPSREDNLSGWYGLDQEMINLAYGAPNPEWKDSLIEL